jgi:hypothetical protein
MKSSFTYTRITAKAMRKALIEKKGYNDEDLPTDNIIGNILDCLGYNLKRVQKSKPVKKIKEVDEIFENVWELNRQSEYKSNGREKEPLSKVRTVKREQCPMLRRLTETVLKCGGFQLSHFFTRSCVR